MAWRKASDDNAIRITTAAADRGKDTSVRQRRYLISMVLRSACFVGAIVAGDGWLRWVLIAAAVLLPYVAVVMANSINPAPTEALPDAPTDARSLPTGSTGLGRT
jgi:hypothetical protein